MAASVPRCARGVTPIRIRCSARTRRPSSGVPGIVVRVFQPARGGLRRRGARRGDRAASGGTTASSPRSSPARRCRSAIACASSPRTARPGSAATRTASGRRSASWTCISSAKARTAGCGRCSARTCATMDGDEGAAFAVWAPNAERVSVVGDFCQWDGRLFPMRRSATAGVWELFVPGVRENALYKFELRTQEGALRVKTDPFALKMEQAPATASIVVREGTYSWQDDEVDERALAPRLGARADAHLRGAPRLVGARARGGQPLAQLSRDRAAARRARAVARLHARRAAAGHGASVLRIVGLSGHRLLRADRRATARPTTSASSSTRCTRRASA